MDDLTDRLEATQTAAPNAIHRPSSREDALVRIERIRIGVPAHFIGRLASQLGLPKDALIESLGMSRATVHRKTVRDGPLSPSESERVLGLQDLLGLVENCPMDATPPSAQVFNAGHWLGGWLTKPLPALAGRKPASLLDTIEGQRLVADLLRAIKSGAYV